ncbi:group II intron maturase-specific domain-containing protein [Nocardia australiensis]|uniref:group II intron maturase-specific domain-containing protein n=1 Tax=Nocardia australiensis TaxID=2887191 RepID=UPI001D140AB4|nr:group II intron maturase-specific domain-containing protein [Nocardia australiensis]
MSEQNRRWRPHRKIGLDFAELAHRINPIARGWMRYYGACGEDSLAEWCEKVPVSGQGS